MVLDSRERILTTHTGSLPCGEALTAHMVALSKREAADASAFSSEMVSVAEEVVWEKLRSLRAGADLASERLGLRA